MKVKNNHYRSIWFQEECQRVQAIDQRFLPHEFKVLDILSVEDTAFAIKEMVVRGAPLIGATAAFGMYIAAIENPEGSHKISFWKKTYDTLYNTRPTAVNLRWALDKQMDLIETNLDNPRLSEILLNAAKGISEEDIHTNFRMGQYGLEVIRKLSKAKNGEVVNIMTHCNAGWLATVDWGTATSPIYQAFDEGIKLHVWVDETRPRNQGAHLTAWELGEHGVPHTLIVDNAGGHLMQHGQVDMLITGTDRTTRCGDVCNKIGTYLKALAAYANGIPFYVCLPSQTIDWKICDGLKEVPIEQRSQDEVRTVQGWDGEKVIKVEICPATTQAANYAFDVTPAKLVTGLITERGICEASENGLLTLFPEFAH